MGILFFFGGSVRRHSKKTTAKETTSWLANLFTFLDAVWYVTIVHPVGFNTGLARERKDYGGFKFYLRLVVLLKTKYMITWAKESPMWQILSNMSAEKQYAWHLLSYNIKWHAITYATKKLSLFCTFIVVCSRSSVCSPHSQLTEKAT